jgi:ribosomal protein S5
LEAVANASSISGLVVRLLKMRVIKNMTKNGKYARFSSLVAVGNGRGAVGVSHSKAIAAADAVSKATKQATRLMEYFPRWQDRTLFHDDIVKFQATILIVRPAAPGAGRRCHPAISEICRCMGIKDISAKVHGSRHSMNVAEAFLMALRRQKTPEMVSQESGMRIVDVLKVYQEGCEELSRTLRSERYSTLDLKRQWNNQ